MKLNSKDLAFIKKGLWHTAIVTVLILLLPLVAMQFTSEVNWDILDFIVMAGLCFTFGSLFVVVLLVAPQKRVLIGITLAALFVVIWAELAVGIFTNLGS